MLNDPAPDSERIKNMIGREARFLVSAENGSRVNQYKKTWLHEFVGKRGYDAALDLRAAAFVKENGLNVVPVKGQFRLLQFPGAGERGSF